MLARKRDPEQFFPGKSLCDWRCMPDPGKYARKILLSIHSIQNQEPGKAGLALMALLCPRGSDRSWHLLGHPGLKVNSSFS